MRIIAHLSDLHFGRIDQRLLAPLRDAVTSINPDVVAISGDLTQRARTHEFIAAREFLDQLPQPQIVVPGNHDVPLYNVLARFVDRLEKYRQHIIDDLRPTYVDEEMAVFGVNTARSLTFKGGRINFRQIDWLRDRMCSLDKTVIKVVVTHHPFDLPHGLHSRNLVGRAPRAVTALAKCGADLFLAGHLHVGHTGHTATRYRTSDYSALVVQAGTASSTRGRGEANSFNVLRLEHPQISVERFLWTSELSTFRATTTEQFRHTKDGWVRADDERSDQLASNA